MGGGWFNYGWHSDRDIRNPRVDALEEQRGGADALLGRSMLRPGAYSGGGVIHPVFLKIR